MSLLSCLRKAAKNVSPEDRAALLALNDQHLQDGKSASEAAQQAVRDMIEQVRAEREALQKPALAQPLKPEIAKPARRSDVFLQPAFHGSPHQFDKFSLDKMGTGEGAQAFGWGLYFTENKEIAEHYRKTLSDSSPNAAVFLNGERVPSGTPEHHAASLLFYNDNREIKATAKRWLKEMQGNDGMADTARKAGVPTEEYWTRLNAFVQGHNRKQINIAKGQTYEVEVPEDDTLMLWDKPMSSQPQFVKDKLAAAGILKEFKENMSDFASPMDTRGKGKGENLYNYLAWKKGGPRQASEYLGSLGIPGHKFKQNTLTGNPGKGFNFVIWNEDAVTMLRTLYQGEQQAPRGTFNPETNTVALLKAANLSTFLHESGHFFLEVLDDIAGRPDAPQQIKDDFASFLRWTGVEAPAAAEGDKSTADERRAAAWRVMDLEGKRPHHEDFARGFEAYLFEGKAPSVEMQGVFQRFRAWLLNVYRDISNLNVTLNKEIRGVFDRMLATTDQIRMAEDVRGYEALFQNKPQGMTDDEWAVYQVQANAGTQEAIEQLQSRSLSDLQWSAGAKAKVLAKLQREAAARRKEMQAAVRTELEDQPVYQAIAAIKEQRKSDPQDRAAVKAWQATRQAEEERLAGVVRGEVLATPEGAATAGIQRGQFLARNKRQMANEVERRLLAWERENPRPKINVPAADLEAVAALHKFSSGDELAKALEAAPPLKDAVEAVTDQRMLERYGDLNSPEAIERAAEAAIHNDARLRFVATEANALRKAIGQPALLAKAIRQFAADIVARTRVRDLSPALYTAAEKRAGRDAERAMREGKLEDAAVQKRNQLINGQAAKEVLDAQEEAQKAVDYLKRLNRDSAFKGIDADYVDQIHALLERYDLRPASNKALERRQSLADWLVAQAEEGIEPDIPPELVAQAGLTHYRNLTMEQLRGLRDTVKQIEHLGRLKKKLLTAKDQRDYEAVRDSIVQSIHDNSGGKTVDNRTRQNVVNGAIRMFNGYLLEHRKLASLVREMDGFKDGGVFWEYLVRTMNDAGNKEATMRADATQRLLAIVRPMLEGGKRGGRGEFFPSVNASFNREERLGIALNMGNAGNMQRLLDGEGWTLAQVKPVLDTLSEADWRFVQQVWDFLETFRPEIGAKERRVYGKEPNWVDPQPLTVQTADGKTVNLRGGYYPIKYDPARSQGAAQQAEAEAAEAQLRGAFTSSTTRRSFTKERAAEVKGRPLMYSTDALFNGVNEIIHDLSWHEWLIDANKLLRSTAIDNAVRSRYGAQVMNQLRSAVKDIAAGEFPSTKAFERVLGELRAGAAVAGLGLNILNSVINVQGITQSMVRIGPKWTAIGVGKFAQNPMALSREVSEKSSMMANRAKTLNREVNEIQSMVRDKSKVRAAMDRALFMPLTITQQMVDLPTWWGAYQKALDGGNTEERAVDLADQAVLDAQSGGQIKDLSGIQRGGAFQKVWTTFYGFFNSTYNLSVEATKATNFKSPGQVIALATNYLLLWTIPALMGTLLKNALSGGDWDEEKLAKKAIGDQISYLMGMMVGARDLAGAAQSATGTNEFSTGYGGPSGARFIGEVYKLAQQAHQGEPDMAFFKALSNVIGILFKLPSGQINRTMEGSVALSEGKTSNPGALITGPPPKH